MMASGVESPENGRPAAAIAFDVVACDSVVSPPVVPERVRRRLAESPESKAKWPTSLEEIQAKLREADQRRQVRRISQSPGDGSRLLLVDFLVSSCIRTLVSFSLLGALSVVSSVWSEFTFLFSIGM